ncbi:MAG: Nif11-like leader peptide family RiPP precursor [Eubacteriales bacterium SKADARSKE-1]|nr:Nif11-like leader peptide family RiPP precursor [Eubacteriales bacterium SKADARSKE-1]
MKALKEFKEKLKSDQEFKNKFLGIKDQKEAIELARKFGFEIKEEDLEEDSDLSEDMLEAVAGGKGNSKAQVADVQVVVTGQGSTGGHWGSIDQGP